MLKTSVTILTFVYCHIFAAFAVVYRRLFASQPLVVIINTDKPKSLWPKKILRAFLNFLRSNMKIEASYPRKNKMEIIERCHTPFNSETPRIFVAEVHSVDRTQTTHLHRSMNSILT